MKGKINITEACDYLAEGTKVKDLAEYYQVTETAVYNAKNRLKSLVCAMADKNMTKQQIIHKYGITEACFLMLIGDAPYKEDGDEGAVPEIIPSSADGGRKEKQGWSMPYANKTKIVQASFNPDDIMEYVGSEDPYWVMDFGVDVTCPKLVKLSDLTLKQLNAYSKSPTAVIFTIEKAL